MSGVAFSLEATLGKSLGEIPEPMRFPLAELRQAVARLRQRAEAADIAGEDLVGPRWDELGAAIGRTYEGGDPAAFTEAVRAWDRHARNVGKEAGNVG